ncbi:VWA domain-containing protein [Ichthyenterobacterium sp. W332]|uniref:VWA domain-containing protein n=1 Tax=Microcosmobacter mediterraneus TaxID=3075607 RepID=A0ABU2YJG0_9FLAO|nr:VWA domain-containing protein [Ichthyenterobacterium sp. W332]MDT0557819.1 VWA domain-containing protein [Ichthyenterobacterium sp. W332]
MKSIKSFIVLIIVFNFSCTPNDKSFATDFPVDNSLGDQYTALGENPFINTNENPVSTFSVDADGASYANVRRFINQDQILPPNGAVRIEELINYFNLDYDYSDTTHPMSLNGEISTCPWNIEHKLLRLGIKGKPISESELPASNFVFLIDVSGSMGSEDKLELLKNGFNYLVDELNDNDRVAIVTYAGNAGLVLPSTPGSEKQTIKGAINSLGSGGSTAGAAGITTAYEIAQQYYIDGGNNRIVLGTDGDFNVGISSQEELVTLIEQKRDLGIFLTVLGVGRGNLNDAALEQIANNGNGTYEYLDSVEQLRKVFIYDYQKFFTVAKDVKIQVNFNEDKIESYRLIGYENRILSEEDFENDEEDAGEIGANQNITALYEIIPVSNTEALDEKALTLDFRYKLPESNSSIPLTLDIFDQGNSFSSATDFMQFTASVASFGMLISDSEHKGNTSYSDILSWLNSTSLNDEHGFKSEFRNLVQTTSGL